MFPLPGSGWVPQAKCLAAEWAIASGTFDGVLWFWRRTYAPSRAGLANALSFLFQVVCGA